MKKVPFVTNEQLKSILEKYPTPFHLYDEKGIRENAKAMYDAFSWNKGFREYFAVKADAEPLCHRDHAEGGLRLRLLISDRADAGQGYGR